MLGTIWLIVAGALVTWAATRLLADLVVLLTGSNDYKSFAFMSTYSVLTVAIITGLALFNILGSIYPELALGALIAVSIRCGVFYGEWRT